MVKPTWEQRKKFINAYKDGHQYKGKNNVDLKYGHSKKVC